MKRKSREPYLAHYRGSDGQEQGVEAHLEGVATFARGFAGKVGLAPLGELMGILHDLGKYSDRFQAYIRSAVGHLDQDADEYIDAANMKGKIDHSTAGAQYIWDAFDDGNALEKQIARQIMAICIASHHSGLIDCISPDGSNAFRSRLEKPREVTHFEEAAQNADDAIVARINGLIASTTVETGVRGCLDALASGKSPETLAFHLGLLTRFLFSALIDADRLDTSNFEKPSVAAIRHEGNGPGWPTLIDVFERHIRNFKQQNPIDEVRTDISLHCQRFAARDRGLYQLTVPTGGGKTLASLRFGLHHAERYQMDRIVYVIPYTSIIDQNASVVRDIFERAGYGQVVLEHHSNLTPEKDTWQSKILAENWDAPIVFTTAVQFLETLFASGTRGARRMHQLANTIIVFDEIQTIPIKTVHLFNNAIDFLVEQCGSSVVFCTATQPLLHQVNPVNGAAILSPEPEMMPDVSALFTKLQRVTVEDARKPGGWTTEEVATQAIKEVHDSGSALVIVNTKSAAQQVYARIHDESFHTFHLSTNMCAAHRMNVLDRVRDLLARRTPVACVSTQLIEAGVDVDFGSVIRHLAGLDSIAQAAGRCNRNGSRKSGTVLIVNPASENLDRLPEIRIAREKAERVLDEYRKDPAAFGHDVIGPKAMEQYFRYYFFERANEMAYPVGTNQIDRDDTLLSLLSQNSLSVEAYKRKMRVGPPLCLRQSFRSAAEAFQAIDAPTEGIVVPYEEEGKRIIAELCSAYEVTKRYVLLKRAQRYSVNVFPQMLRKLIEMKCVHEAQEGSGIKYLDAQYYSDEFGISLEKTGDMEFLHG